MGRMITSLERERILLRLASQPFYADLILAMSYRLRIETYAGQRQLHRFYLRDE